MYKEYFGFSELPFQLTTNPRFFYSNRHYQEAFTGLRWGIKLRRGLMVMTGEDGTGKTTLLRMVAEKFESHTHAALISHPGDFTELLRHLLIEFGLTNIPDDRLMMMLGIRRYLTAQFKQDRIVGVLLDEAQAMDIATLKELELLSDLETDNDKLLQIVLVGSPELATKLDHPELQSLRRRLALWFRIAPLQDHEISSYIDYRVVQAGYKGQDLFSPLAVEQVARYSKGIPRLINKICDNALLAAHRVGQKYISPEIIDTVARDLRLIEELEDNPHHSSFAADQSGKETRSNPTPRLKNPGLLKIATPLTICALVGSVGALYFSERERLLGLSKSGVAGRGQAISEGIVRKADSDVLMEESSEETPAMQAPALTSTPPIARKANPLPKPRMTAVQTIDRVSAKVFLHTAKESSRSILEEIGDALRVQGYTIPETRLSSSRTQGDVRFFFSQDRLDAETVKSIVESELARLGYRISLDMLERDGKKFQFAAPGKIEVWIPPLPRS